MAQLHVLKAKAYVRSGDALAGYRALTNFTLTTLEHWTVLQQICSQLSLPQCRANSLIAIQTFAGQSAPLQQDEILHALLEARRTPTMSICSWRPPRSHQSLSQIHKPTAAGMHWLTH